jgi:predicted secreted Zn-dependent protease
MQVELSLRKPVVRTYPRHSSGLETVFHALERRGWWGRYKPNEHMTYVKNGRGRVETIVVAAAPEITLPAWSKPARVPAAARRAWNRMVAALLEHERQHHRFFVRAAREWKSKLEANGDLTEQAAHREWEGLCRRSKRLQDDYDRRTKHGRTEGVVLAPAAPRQKGK